MVSRKAIETNIKLVIGGERGTAGGGERVKKASMRERGVGEKAVMLNEILRRRKKALLKK